jgi:hypothetical protein
MDVANVELTQVVSQMSGPMVLSLADDLLQTPRMTIEDLIDSTKVGFYFNVLYVFEHYDLNIYI